MDPIRSDYNAHTQVLKRFVWVLTSSQSDHSPERGVSQRCCICCRCAQWRDRKEAAAVHILLEICAKFSFDIVELYCESILLIKVAWLGYES